MSASNATILISMAAGDTTSPWYRIQGFSNELRAFHGQLTTGDTITLQFTLEDLPSLKTDLTLPNTVSPTTTPATTEVLSTTSFEKAYRGGFKWVRAIKTGSAGVARILIES